MTVLSDISVSLTKKGLYESDLSSCGKRKIVCRRMKNQSQANDFSFDAREGERMGIIKKRRTVYS